MARPISVTDEQILNATNAVLRELGLHGLTMSEIARRVGLTRAAITQRFGTMDQLKQMLADRMFAEYEARLEAAAPDHGADGLIAIAEMLGGMIRGRESFTTFMFRYNANLHDPVLRDLEERRGRALRDLIGRVMPQTAIETAAAVDAFMAHMTGSMMNWQTSQHPDAASFLKERTSNWIRLAGISSGEATR